MRESSSLYTPEIRTFINTRDWPRGLQRQIVEYPGYLQLVLFRDNFNAFDGEGRRQVAMMVKETMEKVRSLGCPIYLEVASGRLDRR